MGPEDCVQSLLSAGGSRSGCEAQESGWSWFIGRGYGAEKK